MINHRISGQADVFGAPEGWDVSLDGPLGTISVRSEVDIVTGMPIKLSLWKPTADELEILNGGGMLKLGVCCNRHPVISLDIVP